MFWFITFKIQEIFVTAFLSNFTEVSSMPILQKYKVNISVQNREVLFTFVYLNGKHW